MVRPSHGASAVRLSALNIVAAVNTLDHLERGGRDLTVHGDVFDDLVAAAEIEGEAAKV
jgi:hypothetical protein